MPIYIEKELKNKTLYVTAKGKYTLVSAINTFIEMLDTLKELKIDKAIIDCCQIEDFINIFINIYDYAKSIINECCKKNIYPKLAFIFSSETNMEIIKFGEIFVNNRGINSKAFKNTTDAINWLEFNACNNISNA